MLIPSEIYVSEEFWPAVGEYSPDPDNILCGKVLVIFPDSEGEMHCAFEMPDMLGVFVISLGSVFFKGFEQPQRRLSPEAITRFNESLIGAPTPGDLFREAQHKPVELESTGKISPLTWRLVRWGT